MFTPHNMSHVTCQMSCVTCHVSRVTCHVSHVMCHMSLFFFFFFWAKWSAYSSKSSKYHKSQTRTARELKFWENVHPPQHVACHMTGVTCHMSLVACHVSHVTCHKFFSFYGQSGEVYQWRVCYQWGLPHLVSIQMLVPQAYSANNYPIIEPLQIFLLDLFDILKSGDWQMCGKALGVSWWSE